jgi:hypothetical protein
MGEGRPQSDAETDAGKPAESDSHSAKPEPTNIGDLGKPGDIPPAPLSKDEERIGKDRHTALTFLLIIFAVTIATALGAAFCPAGKFGQMKELLPQLLTAETGLLGSAIGYYFGSKSKN